MMRALLLSCLLSIPCFCQTTTTPSARTSGPCSPAVSGNNNRFTINCEGITQEQFSQFLEILNKIANEQLDPKTVMAKLDDIDKGVKQLRISTQSEPHKYDDVLERLTAFMDEAGSIQGEFVKRGDTQLIKTQWTDWNARVQDFLEKNLGNAGQFRNSHGNAMMGVPAGRSIEGGSYWQDIQGKKDFLKELSSQLLLKAR